MKRKYKVFFVLCLVFMLSSCASHEGLNDCVGRTDYGFWEGLLHGFFFPILLIKSAIFENVSLYAANNGSMYDFGFVLGILIIPVIFTVRDLIATNGNSFKDSSPRSS